MILDKNLAQRILSALFYVGFIFLGTLVNKYFFTLMLITFAALCLYELIRILKYESNLSILITVGLVCLLFYLYISKFFLLQTSFKFSMVNLLTILLFILASITILFFDDELHTDQGKIIFTTIYIGLPFSLAFTIPTIVDETKISTEILLIFCLIWLSDTAAFFIGKLFGKRKLASKISKKKTVEGFLGGIICVVISGYLIQNYMNFGVKGNWAIIGLIIAITAPIGDLVESKIKRTFNVKDSSNLLPGHGGFLDRLDSFIFCIPFLFLYFIFALKFN